MLLQSTKKKMKNKKGTASDSQQQCWKTQKKWKSVFNSSTLWGNNYFRSEFYTQTNYHKVWHWHIFRHTRIPTTICEKVWSFTMTNGNRTMPEESLTCHRATSECVTQENKSREAEPGLWTLKLGAFSLNRHRGSRGWRWKGRELSMIYCSAPFIVCNMCRFHVICI